ncbi:TNF receptor-associated factor 6-like [Clytia hemisphaerica]
MNAMGGYDVEFLHEQFDDMKCSICLLVLREPMQADECGHRFCKSCVVNIKKSGQKKYICPQDRTKMSLFRDKGREREILNRPVKCIHHKEGCCWANALRELENHTKKCDFEKMVCPFNDCGYKFQRRFLAKHNKEDCLYRTMLCPFCDEKYSFYLEQEHIVECDYLPVCCDYCQAQEIPRHKMETHLLQECAKAPRKCDFVHLGCKEQMLMCNIAKHNTNFSDQHINLALQKISAKEDIIMEMGQDLERVRNNQEFLQQENAMQAEEIDRLKKELHKQVNKRPEIEKLDKHIWTIWGLTNEIEKAKKWKVENASTKCFYTSRGYHLKVHLYPNYHGNSIALFSQIVSGEFDEKLKWPMERTQFHFSILNKDKQWTPKFLIDTSYHRQDKTGAIQKPPHTYYEWSTSSFLNHVDFPTFLRNDKLTIGISVSSEKKAL